MIKLSLKRLIQSLLHCLSHLKFYDTMVWDGDFLKCLGILSFSAFFQSWLKYTEITKLKTIAFFQFFNDFI